MTNKAARVIYPELPDPLTPGDLQQLFSPSFDERQWAPTIARKPSPSAVLARVNSYSIRNRFALALKELGNAVRTTYLLEWIMDDSLRRTVHKGTTKNERHRKFAKHLAFGAAGHLRSNDAADQEKAIVYNEFVANAVALQNVVDQTPSASYAEVQGR